MQIGKPKSAMARSAVKVIGSLIIMFGAFTIFFYYGPVYPFTTFAPEQPIPYSHKLHAGDLNIPCQYCHTYARRSEMAGIPSVSKCMNCHSNITSESGAIEKLVRHFDEGRVVEWTRIYDLPDHVWFSHKRHIVKKIKCRKCHGPVETMEVNARVIEYRMGFCLNCHQKEEASTDCWTCHT